MTDQHHIITFSRYITQLSGLDKLLGGSRVQRRHLASLPCRDNAWVVGWGLRPSTRKARQFAQQNQLPYLTLEDGFLRSVDLGVKLSPTLSIVADDIGTHYDATRPSRLEHLLNGLPVSPLPGEDPQRDPLRLLEDDKFLQRARHCIDAIVSARLSKYNTSPEFELPPSTRPRVLVVDQTAGDRAISYGLADAERFRDMLRAAREENPLAEILIKTHPDVLTGQKRAHLGPDDLDERTLLLTDNINPIHLMQQVERVYVVTSQLGFEALMTGRPVTCFGAPFYAGWGLTDDRCQITRRRARRSLEQVFAASYMLYARYIDPDLGTPCEIERVIAHLALQRRYFHDNAGTWLCCGFDRLQRRALRDYLMSPWNRVHFCDHPDQLPADLDPGDTRVLLNPGRDVGALRTKARGAGYPLLCLSRGVLPAPVPGRRLVPPASLIIDDGSFCDASGQQGIAVSTKVPGPPEQLQQDRLAACRPRQPTDPAGDRLRFGARPGQAIILVAGHCPACGGDDDSTDHLVDDSQTLTSIRQRRPDAWLLYAPYREPIPGMRRNSALAMASGYDRLLREEELDTAIDLADEVHTRNSPLGLAALLHGRRVVVYGRPLYAATGPNTDNGQEPRVVDPSANDCRGLAGLVHYPRYLNDETGQFTTAEMAMNRFALGLSELQRGGLLSSVLPTRYWRRIEAFFIGKFRQGASIWSRLTGK